MYSWRVLKAEETPSPSCSPRGQADCPGLPSTDRLARSPACQAAGQDDAMSPLKGSRFPCRRGHMLIHARAGLSHRANEIKCPGNGISMTSNCRRLGFFLTAALEGALSFNRFLSCLSSKRTSKMGRVRGPLYTLHPGSTAKA